MVFAVGVCGDGGLAMHVDVCTHAHIHLHNLYTHVVLHMKSGGACVVEILADGWE